MAQRERGLATQYPDQGWYCMARLPRRVVPIKIDRDRQLQHRGTKPGRPTYNRYSDKLNHCMSKCLGKLSRDRLTTLELLGSPDIFGEASGKLFEGQWEDMGL